MDCHDITERELAVTADGYCPLCMADEIARLQEAKRHALSLADAKGKENVELRAENGRLREIVRVNGLRWGHTHAEIDAILSVDQ